MIDKLGASMTFQQEVLNLRQQRQQVLANNIANADTPGYKARDFDFSRELERVMARGRAGADGLAMTTTSKGHIAGKASAGGSSVHDLLYRVPMQPSLDGNTVDMDLERSQFAENALRQQASLSFVNSRIQGLKAAMRPE
ncbi:flagellar basal body rod protein FlgB [Pistricoccus aurantiacus]|uniref:Flagellar basal body rod protein FlgB n=1 Tax=Pistricoccus aurantiacus TaxID=1883414 RepID=A0A5B8SVT8_9GAMM|nr:flagellar basal body rod protein FlgB [Pistricoccus aurantiacus]QEA39685.1 flagellar basal body rod protein FlgB [Pistricoccus aurantiacus]